jgi:hypothetical protein
VPPIPAETFNVNARDLDWVNRQCTMQPLATLGPQTVRMKLPQSVRVKSIELLQAGQTVAFDLESQVLQFTIPRVEDYEVAAITVT